MHDLIPRWTIAVNVWLHGNHYRTERVRVIGVPRETAEANALAAVRREYRNTDGATVTLCAARWGGGTAVKA